MVDYESLYQQFDGHLSCGSCVGLCCLNAGAVVLFPGEANYLASIVPGAHDKIGMKMIAGQKIEYISQPCPFHVGERCVLGEVRPLDCRLYPFDWCINGNRVEIFFSRDCQAAKLEQSQRKEMQKYIRKLLTGFSREWLRAASLFGPCGLCGKRDTRNCELWEPDGYNMEEW